MADVYGTNGWETIDGSDGVTNSADTIFGYLGNDVIFGLGGNDTIKGGGGADSINGGIGSDTVEYTDSTVGVIVNLKENHGINGTAQGDTFSSVENITGSGQGDSLTGSDGNNTLKGLEGNDHLEGGLGADVLIGGTGIDTARYLTASAGVTVSLLSGHGSGGDAAGDDLIGIENVMGSDHSDTIWGDNGVNVLFGGGGNNTLKGFGGSDTLHGGFDNDSLYGMDAVDQLYGSGGDDYLDGGAGADFMSGGTDNDTYIVDNFGDVVTEVGGQGTLDRVKTSTTYALTGGSDIELLETLDTDATTAIDLVGNWINNTIIGNAGTNVIVGGAGLDTMVGGGGADIFVWNSIAEMGSTVGANSDTVGSEFNALIGDKIALNPIDADGNAGNGDTAFTFIGDASNPFTAAGQVSWFNNGPGTDTYLLLNTNGDAAADGVIRVIGVHTVDAGWFVV
jgi:Ca2+-binding RTX toxin-like protein